MGSKTAQQQFLSPPPTDEDANQAFQSGFSQMAHNVLAAKYPELVSQVGAFKVIRTDLDTGSGVGVFSLVRGGETLHIPVILANNQIKPMELVYSKDKNIFLPLKQSWLEELDRGAIDSLGETAETPKNLKHDIDIRNLMIPPSIGRYSYASENKGAALTRFLYEAPNHVKQAFAHVLETNPKILKYAFETFNGEDLLDAMRPTAEKTASAWSDLVSVLTPDDSATRFREVFGDAAADAWQESVKQSYVVKDRRIVSNAAINAEEPVRMHEAKENGFYRLQLTNGKSVNAVVIANPQPLEAPSGVGKRTDLTPERSVYKEERKKTQGQMLEGGDTEEHYGHGNQPPPQYIVYTENKQIISCRRPPVGEKLAAEDAEKLVAAITGDKPVNQGFGMFVCYKGGKVLGTKPFDVSQVSTDSSGTRRIKTGLFMGRTLVTDSNSPIAAIVAPAEGNITYIPTSYVFVKGERGEENDFLQEVDNQLRYHDKLRKHASHHVTVRGDSAGLYVIQGSDASNEARTKLGTTETLIKDLNLRARDAEEILEKVAEDGKYSFYLLRPLEFLKYATWLKKSQMPMPPMPPQGTQPPIPAPSGVPMEEPMSTEMSVPGGMASPEMMPPMAPLAPPPPSPVDRAVVEISSQLAQQAADVAEQLAEQERDLAANLQILEAVKTRAEEIASGGGMGAGAGAAPMPPEELGAMAAPPMEAAADIEDPEAFEATAIGSLAANANLKDIIGNYIPNLEEALDNLGRILLSIWMQEDELQERIGEMDYIDLEEKLRNVFNNLGSLLLRINQTAMTAKAEDEEEIA